MDNSLEILQLVSQGGLLGVGALATVLVAKYFNKKIMRKRVNNPRDHSFFDKIDYEMNVHLSAIKLKYNGRYCVGRTRLFNDMMKTKFWAWDEAVTRFIGTVDREDITGCELERASMRCINEIISCYEASWVKMGVPDNVIQKFRAWHGSRIKLLIDSLRSICTGESFSSVREKLNAILEIHNVLVVITLLDVEQTLGDMNGELSGVKYRSFIIE